MVQISYAKTARDAYEAEQQLTWELLVEKLDCSLRSEGVVESTQGPVAKPLVISGGNLIEKTACNFTHSHGDALPEAASSRNPQLAGKPFSASSFSVIVHPKHPHIPTAHMNVRFFFVHAQHPHWHFGGGMDMTPYVLYEEDATEWHRQALDACTSESQYNLFKKSCDEYFYLPHRKEARGIGGLFFDDLNEPDFDSCLKLTQDICESFRTAYATIFMRRRDCPYTAEDEAWMLNRRSRYAEFNLLYDRGTKYGLQSGRRVESVLASLPPRAEWHFKHGAQTSEQRKLLACLSKPRDWLAS